MKDMPDYLAPLSRGEGVRVLKQFLVREGFGEGVDVDDPLYDEPTRLQLVAVIRARDPDTKHTGKCGPKTIAFLLQAYGFDLRGETIVAGGYTWFVQSDGTTVKWSPTDTAD